MAKLTWKPGTMVYPVPPALISCGTIEAPNVFTAAWTGTTNSDPAAAFVSIRPERYSYGLIKESGEFVINLTTERLIRVADFVGVKSGRDINKFKTAGITAAPATKINAPILAESPVNIECRVTQVIPLGSHDMFLATVLAVNVDEKLLDNKGVLHLEKAGLASFVHGKYYAMGRQLGSFGYSVKKTGKSNIKERK